MYCNNFNGGYCEKINTHVPRNWCEDRCKFGKNLLVAKKKKAKAKHRKPTVIQMAAHFAKAMSKWMGAGVPVVSKEIYIKRRVACSECHDGSTCPVCGCQLWAKAALETEKCPKNKWEIKE